MTPNKEDYIKQLYKLGAEGDMVSNKSLSHALGVSPASVTEMLTKLKRDGYIELLPYKGSRLTERGAALAAELIKNHRLWEVFLVRILNMSPEEAQETQKCWSTQQAPKFAQGWLISAIPKTLLKADWTICRLYGSVPIKDQ